MEISGLSLCDLGNKLENECHKGTYSRKKGFLQFSAFSDAEKALLQLISGISLDEDDCVCFHHMKVFITGMRARNATVWIQDAFIKRR